MTRFRTRFNMERSPISSSTATHVTRPDGMSFEPSTDSAVELAQPEVWRVYKQHSKRVPGIA